MSRSEAINRQELSERLDNDFDLFKELTVLFFDDSVTLMNRIKASIDSGDMEGLRKNSHTLKGAVSNFSAQGAYDASFVLESSARDSISDGLTEKYQVLENEIKAVIDDMKSIIDKGSF